MDTAEVSPIEAIIEDARNGLPYILVDADDRESEGDVIMASPSTRSRPRSTPIIRSRWADRDFLDEL
jgi:3,4-dihydroxy-2-butanone 4-phosphate synthase